MQIKASSWKSERKNNVQTVGNASGTEKKNSHYEIFASILLCEMLTNGTLEVAIRALLLRLFAMWAREMDRVIFVERVQVNHKHCSD